MAVLAAKNRPLEKRAQRERREARDYAYAFREGVKRARDRIAGIAPEPVAQTDPTDAYAAGFRALVKNARANR